MSVDKQSKKQRPDPLDLRTSLSSCQRLPSGSANNTPNLSPAEHYVYQQSQAGFNPKYTQFDSSSSFSIGHTEQWREQQINHIYRQEPYRYKYGAPLSSSTFHRVTSQNVSSSDNNHTKQ